MTRHHVLLLWGSQILGVRWWNWNQGLTKTFEFKRDCLCCLIIDHDLVLMVITMSLEGIFWYGVVIYNRTVTCSVRGRALRAIWEFNWNHRCHLKWHVKIWLDETWCEIQIRDGRFKSVLLEGYIPYLCDFRIHMSTSIS